MARTFASASSEKIDLSLGGGASLSGAITLAAIVKKGTDGSNQVLFSVGNVQATMRRLHIGSSNLPFIRTNNATSTSTGTTVTVADGWCFVAATKTAGTSTPRFHVYKYAANTWDHANAGTTGTDSTPSGASGIAYATNTSSLFFNGDVAVAGAYASSMSDQQVETLAYDLMAWWQVTPNGLWVLDQASTGMLVNDLTGNGANQSGIAGTSVSTNSVPVFTYGHPITVTRHTVSTPAGTGSDTITLTDTGTGANAGTGSDTITLTDSGSGHASGGTTATQGGSGPANAKALAQHQAWRERIRREDDELLMLF